MNTDSIANMRLSYQLGSLGDRDVLTDPIEQFRIWFDEARHTSIAEANAMILATTGSDGVPQARTVLMKEITDAGIVFYTNYESAKGRAIAENHHVCAVFYWPTLQRQVRWTGVAEKLSAQESDVYFHSRPRGSQIGSAASHQSQPVASSQELHERFEALAAEFGDDQPIPRPEHWGGYVIRPNSIEFWQGRENRLHDRILYTREESDAWVLQRLEP